MMCDITIDCMLDHDYNCRHKSLTILQVLDSEDVFSAEGNQTNRCCFLVAIHVNTKYKFTNVDDQLQSLKDMMCDKTMDCIILDHDYNCRRMSLTIL